MPAWVRAATVVSLLVLLGVGGYGVSLVEAKFEDSLVRIAVLFNEPTNMARMGSKESDCGRLFSHAFAKMLGSGAACTWKSSEALVISVGYGATITTTAAARGR